jgi:hypothetical protein
MVVRTARLLEFNTHQEPNPTDDVELLCEDHRGTYVLPFPCRRVDRMWLNAKTGEKVEAEVLGWRSW